MTLDNADQSCSNQLVLNLKPQHDDARERGRRRERESERAQEGWARGASALSQHQDQRSVGRLSRARAGLIRRKQVRALTYSGKLMTSYNRYFCW